MIRIPEPRREVILKFMEMGATEILLPQTEPVEQAKALVDYAMYVLRLAIEGSRYCGRTHVMKKSVKTSGLCMPRSEANERR